MTEQPVCVECGEIENNWRHAVTNSGPAKMSGTHTFRPMETIGRTPEWRENAFAGTPPDPVSPVPPGGREEQKTDRAGLIHQPIPDMAGTEPRLNRLEARCVLHNLALAQKELSAAIRRQCDERKPAIRMSIPVDKSKDTDAVIGGALRDARRLIESLLVPEASATPAEEKTDFCPTCGTALARKGSTMTPREQAAIQELYDATTILQAAMVFVSDSESLLSESLNYAERRVMAARSRLRHLGVVVHVDAGLLPMPPVPPPFDQESPALIRQRKEATQ